MSDEQRLIITGGIGSGKSSVRGFLSRRGWAVLDSDAVGHQILTEDEVIRQVGARWPHTLVAGSIDRRALGREVFAQPEALAHLESIVHPLIGVRTSAWTAKQTGPAAIEVSVLHLVDRSWSKVVVVDAPVEVRLARVLSRGLTREESVQRLAAQPERASWLEIADYVLPNHLDIVALEQATDALADFVER